VTAAGLTDVGAADPHPAVVLRGGKHGGEKFAVGLLDEGTIGERPARLGDAGGERVAHLLQLTEVEDARLAGSRDPMRDVDPAEPLGDERAQLRLKPPHLPPQLDARRELVGREPLSVEPSVLCNPVGYKGQPVRLPVEQIRHKQILSRLEGRGGNP
jgi:hypothetical protein